MNCENCGTKFSDGMCPNCHEELFILETQGEFIDVISDEFGAKVAEQRRELAEQKAAYRQSKAGSVK